MNQPPMSTGTNGATSAHELFVLTDEQILDIEPESESCLCWREQSLRRTELPRRVGLESPGMDGRKV
jgi:hypothetical protein